MVVNAYVTISYYLSVFISYFRVWFRIAKIRKKNQYLKNILLYSRKFVFLHIIGINIAINNNALMNKIAITQQIEKEFAYIDSLILAHTNSAIAKVNAEAMQTYWEIGQYISDRLKSSQWGTRLLANLPTI